MTQQEAIATILVNQRIMRNGSPPISNALDLLPARLRDEVMGDAQAVVEGLRASEIPSGKKGINVPLTDEEQQALDELSRLQELGPERVMLQALRLYQLVTVGGAEVVMPQNMKKAGEE
jgi:hypothetical protein